MKVLFVYKYLTLGGVETVLRARLDGLASWGIDAHAWFFEDLGGRSIFTGRESMVTVGNADRCLAFALDGGFDAVSSVDTEEIFPGFASAPARPRLIIECHSPYSENIEYLRHLGGVQPVAILTPSEYQQRMVRARVGEGVPIEVVPNPVCQRFLDASEHTAPPPPRPVVAWIGRLDTLKNWRGFLKLAGILAARGLEAEFWLVGRAVAGDESAELAACARQAGVLHRLRWYRGVPHTVVPALLDAVRDSGGVLVSTSDGESFGMTIVEAMARRCAVVVPARPPFTEFVEDGVSGRCFAHGSLVSAANQIELLLAEHRLRHRLGIAGRATVLQRFSPAIALGVLANTLVRLQTASASVPSVF